MSCTSPISTESSIGSHPHPHHHERNSATHPVHGMRRTGPRGTSAHRVPISVSRGGRVYEWSTAHAGRYERGG